MNPRLTDYSIDGRTMRIRFSLLLALLGVSLSPCHSLTLIVTHVSHPALSVGLDYWRIYVLAVGANFMWYQGIASESDLNFSVRRSTRLAVPITGYQLGAHLNFTYVPIYG